MTLAKHNYHVAAAIPSHIGPDHVLAALHDHNTCLTLQALTSQHEKLPSTDPAVVKDTFWYPTDKYPIASYLVSEVITFLPWFSWAKHEIKFPAHFQSTPNGLKTRGDANGVTVRAEFRIVEGSTMDGIVEGEGAGLGLVEWVLVEDVEARCSWWLMPFVKGKMEEAHKDICQKVVEKVVLEETQRAVASTAASGKQRREPSLAKGSPVELPSETSDSSERVDSPIPPPVPEKVTYG